MRKKAKATISNGRHTAVPSRWIEPAFAAQEKEMDRAEQKCDHHRRPGSDECNEGLVLFSGKSEKREGVLISCSLIYFFDIWRDPASI